MTDDVAIPAGLDYTQLQRTGPRGWWRPLVGVLGLLVLMFIASLALIPIGAFLEIALTSTTSAQLDDVLGFTDPGPFMLGALLLSLAVMVPLAMLVSWGLHGIGAGLLSSVVGRLRVRYLVGCVGLAVIAMLVTLVVSAALPSGTREELTASPHHLDGRLVFLLLVALVLTPLQAAGEEYLFRGYLTQAFGSFLPTAFAVLVPAVLFALAHGIGQSLPVFVDRLAFGVVAGVLVVMTGGLEAGLAMHLVNNWLAFGLAIVLGSLGDALQPTGGTWWTLPGTLTQSLVYLALAVWLARRQGIATRTPARAA